MKILNFKKKEKEPVRLAKKPEKKPLIENCIIVKIPLEIILIIIIMACFFILMLTFTGTCTDSGMWYNMPHA